MMAVHRAEAYQAFNMAQSTDKYIVYRLEAGEQPAGVAILSNFQGSWYLGQLSSDFEEYFDFVKYQARVISPDLAYGALFYKKCDRDGSGIYIKTSFEPGEKPEWGYIIGSNGGYEQATKYYADAEDNRLGAEFHKLIMRLHAQNVFQQRFEALTINQNSVETSTWAAQKAEAQAYAVDNTAPTPVLSTLATARGVELSELVTRVITKSAAYDQAIADLLAQQQVVIDRINTAQDIESCNVVCEELFGIPMPPQQAARLGLCVEGDIGTRKVPIKYGIQF